MEFTFFVFARLVMLGVRYALIFHDRTLSGFFCEISKSDQNIPVVSGITSDLRTSDIVF